MMRNFCLLVLLPFAFGFVAYDDGCGRYDRCGRLGVCADIDAGGRVCGYGRGNLYGRTAEGSCDFSSGRYDQGGYYGLQDRDATNRCYGLDADLCAVGKLRGCGNDIRGTKYCTVSRFRRGHGCDRCGKRRFYDDFDSCGDMKRYGDKSWHAKVDLVGDVRARGKYDLGGRADSCNQAGEYGDFESCGKCKDYRDHDRCADLEGHVCGNLAGTVKAGADLDLAERYERHDDGYDRYPKSCICDDTRFCRYPTYQCDSCDRLCDYNRFYKRPLCTKYEPFDRTCCLRYPVCPRYEPCERICYEKYPVCTRYEPCDRTCCYRYPLCTRYEPFDRTSYSRYSKYEPCDRTCYCRNYEPCDYSCITYPKYDRWSCPCDRCITPKYAVTKYDLCEECDVLDKCDKCYVCPRYY